MTALTDPFTNVKKKEIKGKGGVVVARVDYVGWSDVADRLDAAAPGWSFAIVNIGEDWCWGRLTIDGRTFENIGYAENADMDWKKEPLKDAVSDALKRCAALAGVARYLYGDHAAPGPSQAPTASVTIQAAPRPTLVPQEPDEDGWAGLGVVPVAQASVPGQVVSDTAPECRIHKSPMKRNSRGWYCSRKVGDDWCKETA